MLVSHPGVDTLPCHQYPPSEPHVNPSGSPGGQPVLPSAASMRPRGLSDSSLYEGPSQVDGRAGVAGFHDPGPRLSDPPLAMKALIGVPDLKFPVRKIAMRQWMMALKRLDCHHPHWADYRLFGEMLGFDYGEIEHMATQPGGATYNIFRVWHTQDGATAENLLQVLHQMNRADIIEEVVGLVHDYYLHPPTRRPSAGLCSVETERNFFFRRTGVAFLDNGTALSGRCSPRFRPTDRRPPPAHSRQPSDSRSKQFISVETERETRSQTTRSKDEAPECGCRCPCHDDRPQPPRNPHCNHTDYCEDFETHTVKEHHVHMMSSRSKRTSRRDRSPQGSCGRIFCEPGELHDPEDDVVYHFCMLVRSMSGLLLAVHRRAHSAYAEPIDWSLMSVLFYLLAYAKEAAFVLLVAHMMLSIAGCLFLDMVLDFMLFAILLVQIYENKLVSEEVKEMRRYVNTRHTVLNGDGSKTVTDHKEISVVKLRQTVVQLQASIRMKLISFIVLESLLVLWSLWVMYWYLTIQVAHLVGVLVCTGELVLIVTVWAIHYRRVDPQLLYGRFACNWDEDKQNGSGLWPLGQSILTSKPAPDQSPATKKKKPEHDPSPNNDNAAETAGITPDTG